MNDSSVLPTGTEPLELADGTLINPADGTVVPNDDALIEVPSFSDIQRDIVAAKRQVADLPVPTGQMNTISIVLVYEMFGISQKDIAMILNIAEDAVGNIVMSDAYSEIKQHFINTVIAHDQDLVRSMFTQGSINAANTMMAGLQSKSENTRISVAKDVLDRAGHRPADVVEHRHKVEGGLTIQYVKKEAKEDIPLIDITPEEVM